MNNPVEGQKKEALPFNSGFVGFFLNNTTSKCNQELDSSEVDRILLHFSCETFQSPNTN